MISRLLHCSLYVFGLVSQMCAVRFPRAALAVEPLSPVLALLLLGICDLWLLPSLETFGAELARLLVERLGQSQCLQYWTDSF